MKKISPVLRPVHKARKSAKSHIARPSARRKRRNCGEEGVNKPRVRSYCPTEGELFAACDPLIDQLVRHYLDAPPAQWAGFLDAWEQCGRRDFRSGQAVNVKQTARNTMTPLGLACLIRYARGYEDELQALAARSKATER